ncbi:hypothetical protein [Bacillus sp. FSL R9-9410]|uniref:hypothetical protein n=1 Tax=Bacillus sp. FSL R9-9410 TaxID=2921590 RepID=UPI003101B2A0
MKKENTEIKEMEHPNPGGADLCGSTRYCTTRETCCLKSKYCQACKNIGYLGYECVTVC